MKKVIITLIMIGLLAVAVIWWRNNTNDKQNDQAKYDNSDNYQATRSGTKIENDVNQNDIPVKKTEKEISNFSTKIYNKDEDRQNNITITCNTLSGKEIQPGETFSFCSTVGKATHEKGYEEADIYVDGKKEQGLGGGNCQVSTTLYNAVLQVQGLEVVEKHEHSGKVPYVENGKDAAVSYGAYDFKFKNNTDGVIKIIMENTPDNITAKLIEIK